MSEICEDLSGRIVIVGSGLAGLMTALTLAPEPTVIITRALIGAETSSAWAQGGIAASIGEGDSAALHLADTLAAGDGLCDAKVAARIVAEAPAAIAALERFGVEFDRNDAGELSLGLEAAHSLRRIVHSKGDGSGPPSSVRLPRRSPARRRLRCLRAIRRRGCCWTRIASPAFCV